MAYDESLINICINRPEMDSRMMFVREIESDRIQAFQKGYNDAMTGRSKRVLGLSITDGAYLEGWHCAGGK